MASALCELPADNAVGQTSLFASVEVAHKDEWLGEKYLAYALAHMLLRNRPGSDGVTFSNGCLIEELAGFRYDKCCEQLRNSGIRQYQRTELGHFQRPVNFREAFLGWIGAILRRGTRAERTVLDHAIIDNSNQHHVIAADSTGYVNMTAYTTETELQESLGEESPSEGSQTEIWRYTKTLQERFAGKDVVPIYNESTIRAHPPKFRAELTYRGQRVSGEAGNKKMAKHRASKKLCESLNINIPD